MNRLSELVQKHPLPTWRSLAWFVMILLTTLMVWGKFAMLDEVTTAMGEVIPQGKIKVIQHLEGGIIETIHTREGDIVKEGTPLVQLNLATGGINIEEIKVRIDGHLLAIARLKAEAKGDSEIDFPKDVAERRPRMAQTELDLFKARLVEFENTVALREAQVRQKELEVEKLTSKLEAVTNNLDLGSQRFEMSKNLIKRKLTSSMDHLKLEAEVVSLQGEETSLNSSIPKAEEEVFEARNKVQETVLGFQRQAQEDIGTEEQALAGLQETLIRAEDQGSRALINSPIDGIVKNLRYNTIGGVVKPGEAIMEIVPSGENLVIEAKLNPVDRGYVEEGHPTVVKISTYDFVRYGGLDGKVIQIAADSSTEQDGTPFFRVVVKTDKTYLGLENGQLPLTPGMEATVDIHTGRKSVLDYLIKPVLKMRHEAFRER
ncbi:MAG: HlyD family type I secretion periplasmic adaptor subunit [Rhodospirillales bacterium]|nr:HlyD family type I secretion periplasmic adaptor subunit [Rhodospirillales bacterium]